MFCQCILLLLIYFWLKNIWSDYLMLSFCWILLRCISVVELCIYGMLLEWVYPALNTITEMTFCITTRGMFFIHIPIVKKCSLFLSRGQWCFVARKITRLVESNGALVLSSRLKSPVVWQSAALIFALVFCVF